MDVNLRSSSVWRRIIVLCTLCALSHSRLAHSTGGQGPYSHQSLGNSYTRTPVHTPRQQIQQNPELSARPRAVVVRCHPDSMEVVVQADLFDTGLEVDPNHLRLGPEPAAEHGACRAVQTEGTEFTIRSHLMECGSKLSSTKDKIIYSTVLIYSPEPSPDGLHRLDGATIPVECHYEKRYAVVGAALQPTWNPLESTISADDHIEFHVQVMTGDWRFGRASNSYFLGEPIHLEFSALMGNHMPLRVYVDRCVATATPDTHTTVKYNFIENNGCLTDAFLTSSKSRFLPRAEEHKLRLQLDAFRFYQEPQNQVYITCHVSAVPVSLAARSSSRACSFIENRWLSLDGDNERCRDCSNKQQTAAPPKAEEPKRVGSSQPQFSVNSLRSSVQNRHEHQPARFIRLQPGGHQSQAPTHQFHTGRMKRGTEKEAGKIVQLGPFTVLSPRKSRSATSLQNQTS